MTLKQLEAFYWAATCASFAVAAERLHLSVSSLSKRIAELEQALAGVGQHRLVAAAVEQRLAQGVLKLGDALGQRRDRQVQALGRHGETDAGGGPVEGFELLEGHAEIVGAPG